MGLFTPKYPKSDTPGATAVPAPRPLRRTRISGRAAETPARAGLTADELRHVAMRQGAKVEQAGEYLLVSKRDELGYSHQRYVKQSDGTWKAG